MKRTYYSIGRRKIESHGNAGIPAFGAHVVSRRYYIRAYFGKSVAGASRPQDMVTVNVEMLCDGKAMGLGSN